MPFQSMPGGSVLGRLSNGGARTGRGTATTARIPLQESPQASQGLAHGCAARSISAIVARLQQGPRM
jgi:hypothetical protein